MALKEKTNFLQSYYLRVLQVCEKINQVLEANRAKPRFSTIQEAEQLLAFKQFRLNTRNNLGILQEDDIFGQLNIGDVMNLVPMDSTEMLQENPD